MALRVSDEDNEKLNPGQADYDRKFNALNNAEKTGNIPGNSSNNEDIKEAEENPTKTGSSDWVNNVSGKDSSKSKGKGTLNFIKKKGPLTTIILTLVGGGLGIGGLLSPGLLLVQVKEMMVNKFNTQLSSMDVRTTNILTKKMGTTSGLCGSKITIKCKYSTMSEKQINNFKNAGIEIVADEEKSLFGRTKPKSYTFEGKTINATSFSTEINTNPKFRSALKVAYNPKLGGFVDSFWKKAAQRLGISKKAAPIDGETDEAKLKSIQDDVSSGENKPSTVTEKDINPETGKNYTAAEVEAANAAINDAEQIAQKEAKAAASMLDDVESAAGFNMGKVANVIKLTGYLDGACEIYRGVKAVGLAAKTVRTLQLARYAMIFLNVADQIKAGTAKAADVSYLGKILTSTSANGKSATDSFGYKYTAYGDKGVMSTSASQFLAGGGLTGKLTSVTSKMENALGGKPKETCKLLANPFVSIGSLLAGIGIMLIPGANVVYSAKEIAQTVGVGVLFGIATAVLPAMLKDIVAGVLVDGSTLGEAAGDAITSGSSGMMGSVAKAGGNAPLTPQQAVAYSNLSSNIAYQYAEEDRLAYSPFDASNSNTFMGSIVSNLLPYISKMSSISGTLSSVASLSLNSFSFLSPQNTKAASVDDYTMCQDIDYKELGIATDPYCNIIYAVPPESLTKDPIDIADALIFQEDPQNIGSFMPQINEETGDPLAGSVYETFVTDCINRDIPLGIENESAIEDDAKSGKECLFGAKVLLKRWSTWEWLGNPPALTEVIHTKYITNNNFYIHYIDQRVENGMETY